MEKAWLLKTDEELLLETNGNASQFHLIFSFFEILFTFFVLEFDTCQNPICFEEEILSFKEPNFAHWTYIMIGPKILY